MKLDGQGYLGERRVVGQKWRYDGPATLGGQDAELWTLTIEAQLGRNRIVDLSHQFMIVGDIADTGFGAFMDFAEAMAQEHEQNAKEFNEKQERLRRQYGRETPAPR